MTVGTLVDRERKQLRRAELVAAGLLALGVLALGVGLGAVLLGGARWLALPRGVPVAIWLALVALLGALAVRTRARLSREATRMRVARVIEDDPSRRSRRRPRCAPTPPPR